MMVGNFITWHRGESKFARITQRHLQHTYLMENLFIGINAAVALASLVLAKYKGHLELSGETAKAVEQARKRLAKKKR